MKLIDGVLRKVTHVHSYQLKKGKNFALNSVYKSQNSILADLENTNSAAACYFSSVIDSHLLTAPAHVHLKTIGCIATMINSHLVSTDKISSSGLTSLQSILAHSWSLTRVITARSEILIWIPVAPTLKYAFFYLIYRTQHLKRTQYVWLYSSDTLIKRKDESDSVQSVLLDFILKKWFR